MDARVGRRVLRGRVLLLGFMVPDEARHWAPMELPETLQPKVEEMESGIRMNFKFKKDIAPGSASRDQIAPE